MKLAKCKSRSHGQVFKTNFVLAILVGLFGFGSLAVFASPTVAQEAAEFEQERSVPDATRERPASISNPAVIEFKGQIDRKLTQYFKNRFASAKKAGVDLLIIEIDSPGGLKIESLEMARALRDCEWAYTIATVENEAISGGALVSLGCDEIQIDPNAKFGDAGEIGFDPEAWAWRLIEPKIESYLSRDARDLAESKGRPPHLAEAMVDKDVLVYRNVVGEGEEAKTEFQSVRADAVNKPNPPWKLVTESGPERFLTLSGQRSVALEMAQGNINDRDGLAKEFGFEVKDLKVYRMTTTDSVVYYLNLPIITGLIVLIGLISFYFELSSPGLGIGGLLAGLCAVLFFWSKFLGGTSGWLEVILFVAGIIFLFTEVFIIPGFGVPGIMGLVLLFASAILASQDFVVPQTAEQWNQTTTTALVMICTGIGFVACAAFISKRMGSIPIFNKLVLAPPPVKSKEQPTTNKDGKPIPQEHPTVSVGDWGTAESLLRPAGRAKFAGRSFDVISDGAFVDSGAQVRVIKIYGNVITVAEIDETDEKVG